MVETVILRGLRANPHSEVSTFFKVIQGFTHAHIDQVGDASPFRNASVLVQDLPGAQIALETLFTGHTKEATHFAAHL